MGAPNLLIVPGAIQPCYVPGMGRKTRDQETVHTDLNFCQAIFAPSVKVAAMARAMPAIP